ncbi:MAE_28990/MAE_18760 family HEPN-like nuclease [Levilactobacillus brevis]|uniref:MAE_28990/MAE_18760 family HEPN-like nuclease n=1 Tax=Levilactobacillus brevis TaxID=1580 RepID=UPI0020737F87|nr:MAE_28990/MAE_18760 family HEPN-like nuclease [Levilactobacillus brevis]
MIELSDYEKKKNELHFYMSELAFLDEISSYPSNPYDNYINKKMSLNSFDMSDFIVILKSNAFMMMYNMIESTVKEMIYALYDEINTSKLTYTQVAKSIQEIWSKYQFANLDDGNARSDKYKDKANKMITSIIDSKTMRLDGRKFKLSGNADFTSVIAIMQNHGITISTKKIGKYNRELSNVKAKRNSLAHGSSSFIESARDTSTTDLVNMNDHVEEFLNQLQKDISKYIRYRWFERK